MTALATQHKRLRKALKAIVRIMGPDGPPCCMLDNRGNWNSALATAKKALARDDEKKT